MSMYKTKMQVLVCSVERGDEVYIPDGNFVLQEGDEIFVTASSTDLVKIIRTLGIYKKRIHEVMIIGGSKIAYYLTEKLIESGVKVKILEKNRDKCMELASALPKATIINADGAKRWVLDSEGLPQADAVVTLTNMDEENLIISKFADFCGVPTVVTKLNRTEFRDLYTEIGIKCVVSPKEVISNDIARYVRAMGNTEGNEVIALHRIGKMEALEFTVKNCPVAGMKLKDIETKRDTLVACINRGGKIIIPKGTDTIENGDTAIIVTTPDTHINTFNDILEDQEGAAHRKEPRYEP